MMNVLNMVTKRDVAVACSSAVAGALAAVAAMKLPDMIRERQWEREEAARPRMSREEFEKQYGDAITSCSSDEGVEIESEHSKKPDIFQVALHAESGRIISAEEYRDIPEERKHVATWFAEDEILAGYDEDLDIIEPFAAYGGIPDEVFDKFSYGSGGEYVMCGDGTTALEIIVSHGNYLEAYNDLMDASEPEVE